MNSNLINQKAFNEGFHGVLVRRSLVKAANEEYPSPLTHPIEYLKRQGQDFGSSFVPAATAAGVGLPLLAAAWYWHNKQKAEEEALGKQANSLGEILGTPAGLATAAFPAIGLIGAYQLAEYLKNKQEPPPQPDLDTILNVNPEGGLVPTQEKKHTP
jgi:hypothetical protein